MCTYDGYVSQYLLRPPRSCDQVMGHKPGAAER